jgi:hypothetical protein
VEFKFPADLDEVTNCEAMAFERVTGVPFGMWAAENAPTDEQRERIQTFHRPCDTAGRAVAAGYAANARRPENRVAAARAARLGLARLAGLLRGASDAVEGLRNLLAERFAQMLDDLLRLLSWVHAVNRPDTDALQPVVVVLADDIARHAPPARALPDRFRGAPVA